MLQDLVIVIEFYIVWIFGINYYVINVVNFPSFWEMNLNK